MSAQVELRIKKNGAIIIDEYMYARSTTLEFALNQMSQEEGMDLVKGYTHYKINDSVYAKSSVLNKEVSSLAKFDDESESDVLLIELITKSEGGL